MQIDRKHEASEAFTLRMPFTVTSNHSPFDYGENIADKMAIRNRVTPLEFVTRLVSKEHCNEEKTFPRPHIKIGGEHLLHLFVRIFDDPFKLPPFDSSKPIQNLH